MAKKETQQRVLVIKNFKNIGVSQMDSNYNLSDKPEELVLNTSYTGDHHGGLVAITIEKIDYIACETHARFFEDGEERLAKLRELITEAGASNILLDWI
ncbi:hypothetical protein [Helicobacter bilis]|uniref:hypothetical protein n=1 Tax=Helicobacter bilis TaxID=37372 RepID=UPI00248F2BB1|nr:hypothetical protein [Helicobacter bilis]